MTVARSVRAEPRPGWRDRLLDEAAALTRTEGWSAVTMGRLAERVGVSRQSVYAQVGSKPALAEALVMRELEVFLAQVSAAFEEHPDDVVAAVRAASLAVLELATVNPLLHAVLSAGHGAESELLPLLTTRSLPLLAAAQEVVAAHLGTYDLGLSPREVRAVTDLVVRLVLSHVMRPSGEPAATADDIAWLVGQVLDPATGRPARCAARPSA